jgi:hypothetical protein
MLKATDWVEHVEGGLAPDDLAERIFAGRILWFTGLPAVAAIINETRTILDDVFAGAHPPTAFRELGEEGFRRAMRRAQKRFAASPQIERYWTEALTGAGADAAQTYRDRLVLRAAPPFDAPSGSGYGRLPPHRDSWGAGLDCQINWWLPIYDLTAERTMAVFPRAWNQKVCNDSAGWDAGRARKEPGYPELPSARERIDWDEALALVVPSGTLMGFSASHLHATVPNTSGEARISSETRTVDRRHLAEGRGAPNLDRAPGEPATAWFRRLDGASRLSDDLG